MTFWKRFWAIMRPFKREIAVSLLWMAAATTAGLASPYANKLVFDLINAWAMPEVGLSSPTIERLLAWMPQEHRLIWLSATILVGMLLADVLATVAGFYQHRASSKMDLRMREEIPAMVLGHLLRLSIGWHVRESTGKQVGQIRRGVGAVAEVTETLAFSLLPTFATGAVSLAVLLILDVHIGALSLGVSVCVAVWTVYDHRVMAPIRKQEEGYEQRSDAIANEAIANVATVQAFGREAYERERVRQTLSRITQTSWAQWMRNLSGESKRSVLTSIVGTLIVALGLWKLSERTLSLGSLVMLLQMNGRFMSAVSRVSWSALRLGGHREPLAQLLDLLDKQPDVVSLPTAVSVRDPRGEIVFDRVTFSYSGNGEAVSEVSFTVAPGEMLALVGPSGSGKSTLASLLLRAHDVTDGAILIDGRDLRALDLESWRAHIGIVPQVVELFSVSIRDNIAYGRPEASEGEIVDAATLAGAHEFILKKPGGYEAIVGERGLDLSGGERQRIGIARAILRRPLVLIFDEATASLDVLSEKRIQEALETLRQGRTTVVIAHRFSTIARADRVVVMDGGRVVAQGTHAELREGSPLYRELERLQRTDAIRD